MSLVLILSRSLNIKVREPFLDHFIKKKKEKVSLYKKKKKNYGPISFISGVMIKTTKI